jgi:hypothetical protein
MAPFQFGPADSPAHPVLLIHSFLREGANLARLAGNGMPISVSLA